MAGPNMEVFRFGFYLFFPIFAMYKFGDPVWFDTYVQPYKDYLLPPLETSNKPPKTAAGLHEELSRLKAARKSKQASLDGGAPIHQAELDTTPSLPSIPAPSRTLEAMAMEQAAKRDQEQAESGATASGQTKSGWGSTGAEPTGGRLV